MDVKEIIKWLFQVKDSNSSNVKSGRFENSSKMCLSVVFLTIFVCSFVGCNGQQVHKSMQNNNSKFNGVFVDNLNNGGYLNVGAKLLDTSRGRSSSVLGEDREKEEFEDETGIIKMIRDGASYLDKKLEESVGNGK